MTHGCNVCRLKAKYKPIIEEKYGRNMKVSVPIEKPKNLIKLQEDIMKQKYKLNNIK